MVSPDSLGTRCPPSGRNSTHRPVQILEAGSDIDCTGRLTRVGSSKSYAFFIEIITKGRVEKGGRCPDGTITVARQGDSLALAWFGSIQGKTIVA
jgi:hypothetical protein